MRIKENYVLRNVAGSIIVVPVGKATINFNGMITLNKSGEFLWSLMEKGAEREELALKLAEKYGIDAETAARDTDDFIRKLMEASLIE